MLSAPTHLTAEAPTAYVKRRRPSKAQLLHRGRGQGCGGYTLPEPTTALPGTPEKIAVLAEHAGRRQALFHPHDAPFGTDGPLEQFDLNRPSWSISGS